MESLQIPKKPNTASEPKPHTKAEQMSRRRRDRRLNKVLLAVSSVLTVVFSISLGVGTAALCAGLIIADRVLVQAYLENPRLNKVLLAVSSVLTVVFSISLGVGTAALCAGLIIADRVLVQAYLENPLEAIFKGFAVADSSAITAPVLLSRISGAALTVAASLLVCIVVIAIVKRVLKI